MNLDLTSPLKVAAVQLECRAVDLAYNLEHAERLATEAFESGACIVALPEFFTSRVLLHPNVEAAILPAYNPALDMMRRLARRYSGFIGGSMLMQRRSDVFNTYCFVQPDGRVFMHDKDLPTMWENAYYVGGSDDGLFETALGGVGAASCWELIRSQTVRRLKGRLRLAMSGNHWWTVPENWGRFGRLFAAVNQYNRYLSENAPVEFARRLGVPVLHAAHAGEFDTRLLLLPRTDISVPYRSRFVGATQIVDAQGRVLASRNTAEGAGLVTANVLLQPAAATALTENGFWMPALTGVHRLFWWHQNLCGRSYYRRHRRADEASRIAGESA